MYIRFNRKKIDKNVETIEIGYDVRNFFLDKKYKSNKDNLFTSPN